MFMTYRRKAAAGLSTLSAAMLIAPFAHAQAAPSASDEAPTFASEEIIVTAEKRESSIQKVPIAVTALAGSALRDNGIGDVRSLSVYIPNFNFGETFGAAKLAIRGISYSNLSTGAEGSVAYNLNDVYVARPAGQLGNFFDIDRVEVLRGPQGTLYGRNATGGTVNVYTKRPGDEWSGYGQLTIGNYEDLIAEAAVGGPVAQGVGVRLAFFGQNRGGYGTNIVTGEEIDDVHSRAARMTIRLEPSSNLTVDVIGDFGRQKDHSGSAHLVGQRGLTGETGVSGSPILGVQLGGTALIRDYDVASDITPQYLRKTGGLAFDARLDMGDVTLRSISAWRHTNFKLQSDLDGTSLGLSRIFYDEQSDQYTQELNLNYSSSAVDLTLGAYYFAERLDGVFWTPGWNSITPGVYLANYAAGGHLKTDGYALFGQTQWHIDDRLTLVLGARYSSEKKSELDRYTDTTAFIPPLDFTAPVFQPADFDNPNYPFAPVPLAQSKRFNSFTPKIGINFQATPDTLLYASVSKGFKAGLFNLGAASVNPASGSVTNPAVDPETVWAYEAGIKARLLDNRLRFNLAGFYYDYRDLQLTKLVGLLSILTNAAKARIYGLELETEYRPDDTVRLFFNGSWLHARFADFTNTDPGRPGLGLLDLEGNKMPQAPDFSFTGGIDLHIPVGNGSITPSAEVQYSSRIYFDEFNSRAISQAPFAKVNLSARYNLNSGFSITAFVKNLTNRKTLATAYQSSSRLGYNINGFLEAPRTYGVRLGYQF